MRCTRITFVTACREGSRERCDRSRLALPYDLRAQAQPFADLPWGEAFHEGQAEDLLVDRAERLDRLVRKVIPLGGGEGLFRVQRGHRGLVPQVAGPFEMERAEVVLHPIPHRAADEANESLGVVQLTLAQRAQHREQSLLGQVLGRFGVPGAGQHHRIDRSIEATDELLLRRALSAPDPLHDIDGRALRGHLPPDTDPL